MYQCHLKFGIICANFFLEFHDNILIIWIGLYVAFIDFTCISVQILRYSCIPFSQNNGFSKVKCSHVKWKHDSIFYDYHIYPNEQWVDSKWFYTMVYAAFTKATKMSLPDILTWWETIWSNGFLRKDVEKVG